MSTIIERMQMFADGRRHLWEKKIIDRKYQEEDAPLTLPKVKRTSVNVVDNFRTSEGKQAYSRRQEQQAISRWWKQEHNDCQDQIEAEEASIELGPEIIEGNA